jgi:hypothetical protein
MKDEPDLRNNRARRFYDIWSAPKVFGDVALRCHAEFAVAPAQLGGPVRFMVESGERFELFVNGEKVQGPSGTWRAPAFTTFDVTDLLRRGENVFELRTRFAEDTELEPCYLLGPFGVWRRGRKFVVGGVPASLTPGAWASQGLPFFGGFISKIVIIAGSMEAGANGMLIAALILMASVIELVYFLRVIHRIWMRKPKNTQKLKEPPFTQTLPMVAMAVTVFVMGIYPQIFFEVLIPAAQELLRAIGGA